MKIKLNEAGEPDNICRLRHRYALFALFLALGVVGAPIALADPLKQEHKPLAPVLSQEALSAKQALANCESGGNPSALNPMDSDGTPSNGMYQFKRSTWRYFVEKYDLWNWREWDDADWENTMWSGEHQDVVVSLMFMDKEVNLHGQFPKCSSDLGLPRNFAF